MKRSAERDRFRHQIKVIANEIGIRPDAIVQKYASECFLRRIAQSKYKKQFILKGGLLIAFVLNLQNRATRDIDITIKRIKLTPERLKGILSDICNDNTKDNITFQLESIKAIRKDDPYGGLNARLKAYNSEFNTTVSIDITTGDIITPDVKEYTYIQQLSSETFCIFGYPAETILAEKVEAILHWSVDNTRPKDFYDTYFIIVQNNFDKQVFRAALLATATHRGREDRLTSWQNILSTIANDTQIQSRIKGYQEENTFAKDIPLQQIIQTISCLLSELSF